MHKRLINFVIIIINSHYYIKVEISHLNLIQIKAQFNKCCLLTSYPFRLCLQSRYRSTNSCPFSLSSSPLLVRVHAGVNTMSTSTLMLYIPTCVELQFFHAARSTATLECRMVCENSIVTVEPNGDWIADKMILFPPADVHRPPLIFCD